jgi:hypothetical protein
MDADGHSHSDHGKHHKEAKAEEWVRWYNRGDPVSQGLWRIKSDHSKSLST